jgi:Spy/CpxP family protein refolding chaperone
MRGIVVLLAAAAAAGCASDMTSPAVQPQPLNSMSAASDSLAARPWGFGRRGMAGFAMTRRLPANLQLTHAQRAQIRALTDSFRGENADDFASMRTLMRQMRAAHRSGQVLSPDQRRTLFQQTAPARRRLMTAQRALAAQVQNVLTTEQKTWLAAHRRTPCSDAVSCRTRFARHRSASGGQTRSPS